MLATPVPGSPSTSLLGSIAAERGDYNSLLTCIDTLERSTVSPSGPPQLGATTTMAGTLAQVYSRTISLRGIAKEYCDVLSILDRSLTWGTGSRTSTLTYTRPTPVRANANRNNQNFDSYWINGQVSRNITFDFPSPNDRYDLANLGVIRSAYEVFHRDDLLTDLFTHLQTRADKLQGLEKADVLLALGYCRWWNDDKLDAEQAMVRAAEAAGGDAVFRLILAEVYERRGSLMEALATVDSVEPIDSAIVEKRENQALRLAVASGNVGRARKAAERLFGLRLDADTQVQLASLMNQLGMHDLGEAVLARARKSAGSKPPSLLALMQQYQSQQKNVEALQIALQILRLRPTSSTGLGQTPQATMTNIPNGAGFNPAIHNAAQDDYARNQAIQAISKSGKLTEFVARAETQLERSPNSMQVLQVLAEYARVANDKEKARSLYERMARTRPDDARLRAQLGTQLFQAGDAAGALEYYRVAIKANPSVLTSQLNPIINAFRQAGKFEDFATILINLDLHAIGNMNVIMNVMQSLMNDPALKERGMALFQKIWAGFPLERSNFINLLAYDDEWWLLPEVYAYARDVVLPADNAKVVNSWSGVNVVQGFGNDSRLITLVNRLLDAAGRQNKLGELRGDIRRAIDLHPGWSGGRVILALLSVRESRIEEAQSLVKDLMAETREPMPPMVRWLIGQDLDENSRLKGLAEELFESAVRDFFTKPVSPQEMNFNLPNQLLARFKAAGRVDGSRNLILSGPFHN